MSRNRIWFFVGISCCFCTLVLTQLQPHGVASELDKRSPPTEPTIAEASNDAATQIGAFKFPSNWTCEVFAAEPDVANPVAFTVDNRGRLFVCESFRQNKGVTDNRGHDNDWLMADLASKTVADRIAYHQRLLGNNADSYQQQVDRIRLLVDSNEDGKVDKSTVFVSGFNGIEEGTGASVLVRGEKVYYTNIPKLWQFIDLNGDGIADERVVLADGFGVRVAFRGHDMHGLTMGPDGRIYFSIGDRGYHVETKDGLLADPESGAIFRCETDGSHLEVVATGLRNPQELAFDDLGNLFTCDNNSDSGDKARWAYIVPGSDSGWRMMYQYFQDRGPFNREKLWYPYDPKTTPAYIVPPIANISDGPAGLVYYPGTGLDESFKGTFFLVDFRGGASNSGIRSINLSSKGAFFEIAKSEQPLWNMLMTDIDFGPDGSIYLSDWVNGWNGEGKGRIYRFFDKTAQKQTIVLETKKLLNEGFTKTSLESLVSYLGHPDRRVRNEAQWELVNRKAILQLATVSKDTKSNNLARVHAVWGLGQLLRGKDSSSFAMVAILKLIGGSLSSPLPDEVWNATLKVIGESHHNFEQGKFDASSKAIQDWVAASMTSTSPRIQAAAAMTAGQLRIKSVLQPICKLIETNADQDPILRHSAIMALVGQGNASVVSGLSKHASEYVRLAAVIALRKMKSTQIEQFLNDASDRVVTEAARAINDVAELHGALPALAKVIGRSSSDPAFLNRVLNAHFRLGQEENAVALVAFAADISKPKEMRSEALEMLKKWGTPGDLDRVMNRFEPLSNRDATVASKALGSSVLDLLKQPELASELRMKALEASAELNIQSTVPSIVALIEDANASGKNRSSAIQWLLQLDKEMTKKMLVSLVQDTSPAVRVEATKQLTLIAPDQSIAPLTQQTLSETLFERQSAWDTLAKIDNPEAVSVIRAGIDRWLNGSFPVDTILNLREAAEGKIDVDTANKVEEKLASTKVFENASPAENGASSEITSKYVDSILGGDAGRGKELFSGRSQLSCVRCHKIGETGGEVGPVLTDIGTRKNAQYLLEAIVDPNAVIAQGFETMIVQTDDGQIISGITKLDEPDKLTLLLSDGRTIAIERDSIDGVKKGQSSMPVDLMKYLTHRELRDLVAYLTSLDGKQADSKIVEGHAVK